MKSSRSNGPDSPRSLAPCSLPPSSSSSPFFGGRRRSSRLAKRTHGPLFDHQTSISTKVATSHNQDGAARHPTLAAISSAKGIDFRSLFMFTTSSASPPRRGKDPEGVIGLSSLPYDLLLNISTFLDLRDVHALHLTCRALYDASTTRTVYRKLANDLLRRCRALPLKGFQRLADLTTEQLIRSVNKATHYESAWRVRAPRPVQVAPHNAQGINPHSNYMDMTPGGPLQKRLKKERDSWYKVVSAPPGEEVDWLSPITSSYTLCATKSGKVVCWDVQSDTCLAEWNPGARWELWKCRVEFEERTVFFTMAKVLAGSYDDDRVMEFVLMRLTFSDGPSGESSIHPPIFSHVTEFRTTGVVMNVFLLDPSERLLSAFIWVSTSNTIGLYALPDWDKREYVFIDTGIECVMSSNWSCILYQEHIVIHCEESEAAYQHFYPLSLLRAYTTKLSNKDSTPIISCRLPPARTLKKRFIFPLFIDTDSEEPEMPSAEGGIHISGSSSQNQVMIHPSPSSESSSASSLSPSSTSSSSSSQLIVTPQPQDNPNPYPFPPWYPESAHFVRQWWPSLPNIPRVSCTVVLLAAHDQQTHRTRFVLAQHYFRVPLDHAEWASYEPDVSSSSSPPATKPRTNGKSRARSGASAGSNGKRPTSMEDIQDDALMHLWYVSTPFEVVRVLDGPEEDEDGGMTERPRPLVAVDFGHAVWIEYVDSDEPSPPTTTSPLHPSTSHSHSHSTSPSTSSPLAQSPLAQSHTQPEPQEAQQETETDQKRLRFVTFPPFSEEYGVELDRTGGGTEGVVHTLQTPPELNLGLVETINIDQSQGAIILSDKMGRIFILCYE